MPDPQQIAAATPPTTIFDTLAQQDTARRSAAASPVVTPPPGYTLETTAAPSGVTPPPGYTLEAQPDIFDQLAANNGQLPDATKKPQGPSIGPSSQASDVPLDRKSTRLNSSHLGISY